MFREAFRESCWFLLERAGAPEVLLQGGTTDTTGNKWLDKHFLLAEVLR